MTAEQTTADILARLAAEARLLRGEAEATRQRAALAQTAGEIAMVMQATVPADLEPQFFA